MAVDLSDPMSFPEEFKSWIIRWVEAKQPVLPIAGMAGYQAAPRITTGAFSDGPPVDAKDGAIWIASVDGNGTRWQFQFNAASGSDHKWEFIGGAPLVLTAATFSTWTTGNKWSVFGPCTWSAVRSGDYVARGEWSGTSPSAGGSYTERGGVMVNSGQGYKAPRVRAMSKNPSAASSQFCVAVPETVVSVSSGDKVALGYSVGFTPSEFSFAVLALVPRRVS